MKDKSDIISLLERNYIYTFSNCTLALDIFGSETIEKMNTGLVQADGFTKWD